MLIAIYKLGLLLIRRQLKNPHELSAQIKKFMGLYLYIKYVDVPIVSIALHWLYQYTWDFFLVPRSAW